MSTINTTNKPVRTRFAPSPTGYVHIGSLRTALFSFLYARHFGGTHILRIEDTDQNRIVEGAVENLLRVMLHMGIEFDEGYAMDERGAVTQRGDHGPYLQSERLGLYRQSAEQLLTQGAAYYCFCDEQRLDELRKEQTALKKPPMYDRHCRNLSAEAVQSKLQEFQAQGLHPVVRQAIPLEGQTIIHDLIYGDITYEHAVLDDQILLKSDGFPTYHLAVVVDDHYMDISHAIRGEEWIPSTPKHILLYQAFGWEPTQFAHLPLILNPDKSKLSKRQGDVAIESYLEKGYLKEALINFVAFLGWNPKTEQEIFSLQDLVAQFDLAKVNKSGAVFDVSKLDWMNGLYIRSKPVGELTGLLVPYWIAAGLLKEVSSSKFQVSSLNTEVNKDYLEAITKLEQERLKKLSEIGERTGYFFATPEYDASLLVWKKSTAEDARLKLDSLYQLLVNLDAADFAEAALESHIKDFIVSKGYDNGSVLWPLRVALTGQEASPGPFAVASTLAMGLGKETVLERIKAAVNKL